MNKKVATELLFAVMAVLAAMGCWFCWHCPSRVFGPHELFWRQLAWNGMGLAVFAAVRLVGWRRMLKAAPWLILAWGLAFVAARLGPESHGTHRWLWVGPFRLNVMTLFMPLLALFAAWLHEKRWVRPWMELGFLLAVVIAGICVVYNSPSLTKRIAAYFSPGDYMLDQAYMARQLQMAFAAADWFGGAGRDLGFLPCPESDGMLSAAALLFGKWFPAAVAVLFALAGFCLSTLWRGTGDPARRRYVLLYGTWLVFPAAYCLMHSLSLLPVLGISPALAGYGGSVAVAAWFGLGGLVAMMREGLPEHGSDVKTGRDAGNGACMGTWGIDVGVWGAAAITAVLLIACAPGRDSWVPGRHEKFAEPRPSDGEFGEFGLVAKRGGILASDGSPLACTERSWRFRLDPRAASHYRETHSGQFPYEVISKGLGVPLEELRAAYGHADSRYVYLKDVEEGDPAVDYYTRNRRWLTRDCGVISIPVQKRVYPLGRSAAAVVGFVNGREEEAPSGAGGLEHAFEKSLRGKNGGYFKELPLEKRQKKARPTPGKDLRTTLVPSVQIAVADVIAKACATNGASSAWGIVMKVPSGEIVAMASWPTFNPEGRRRGKEWNPASAANHAVRDCFEPGGLAKPLTYAIALDAGALSEDGAIDQSGGAWEYNGETFRDEATNSVTVAEAIERRVNIAAGKAACMVGPDRFHAALRRFGFGSKTGVAGIPGEEVGVLASSPEAWKLDKTTAMRVGMGYGFSATGLQIVQAYGTLVNHGRLVRPVLVTGGEAGAAVQAVSPAAADYVAKALKGGVMESTVQMCERDGESGRAAYSATNYMASCAGFHPAAKPEYVIAVSFAKPHPAHTGGEVAAPAFNAIRDSL